MTDDGGGSNKSWVVISVAAIGAVGAIVAAVITAGGPGSNGVSPPTSETTTRGGVEQSTGGNPSTPTSVGSATPSSSTTGSQPPATSTSASSRPPDLVLVRVSALLGESMYAAQVQYAVDGARQEDLLLDQVNRRKVAGVQLAPGEHRYELVVDWVDIQGMTYQDSGAGTLTAGERLTYEVFVYGDGRAALAVSP
jgi:hypothetical protein